MIAELAQESINRMEKRLDEIAVMVVDLRERFARMEGQATHVAVDGLRKELEVAHIRIAQLETANNIRTGQLQASKTWSEWVHRLAPWIFAVALVVWNYMRPPL